jgi:protein O-mannosyl-transferase
MRRSLSSTVAAPSTDLAGALDVSRYTLSGCVGLIVAAITAAYWNSLSVPFQYDDVGAIAENEEIRHLWPLGPVLSPQTSGVAGRPLFSLSFAVNYAIGGLDVFGYHAANIAIHILCAILLFIIVRETLHNAQVGPPMRRSATGIALACALVWGLHPLQTGTVTYISGRSESLMGLWFLLTLYAAMRAHRSPRGATWTALAIVSCALGMASKESMVTAPLIVVLYDRTFLFDSVKRAFAARWHLYLGLAATWVALAALLRSGPHSDSVGFAVGVSAWTYLLNQMVIITDYLRTAVWPQQLVFAYGEPRHLTLADVLLQAGVVTALAGATFWTWLARPKAGFLAMWFFVILAPTSSVVPIATEVGAERRMYLPLAGLVILAITSGHVLMNRQWPDTHRGKSGRFPQAAELIVVALCVTLAARTLHRNAEYVSSVALWRTALESWPSAVAHRNLATALKIAGQPEEAVDHLRQTIGDHPEARYILGVELFELSRFDEAIRELEQFIRSSPRDANIMTARQLVGRAFAARGMPAEAAEQFGRILEVEPTNASAQIGIADALLTQERYQEAVPAYRRYLAGQPDAVGALTNLGIALIATNDIDGALEVFRRAVELEPQNAAARENLANALRDREQIEEADRRANRPQR